MNTYTQFHSNGTWEMAIPNGSYDVTVSVGDAVYGSQNTINVEGVNYWNNIGLNKGQFLQKTKTINVNDGKLTIDSGSSSAGQTKLDDIEIVKNSADTTPPTTPQQVHAESIQAHQLTLLWDPSTDDRGISGYKIYRNHQEIATVTNAVYYTDTGLTPETTYTYQVAAVDTSNNVSVKSTDFTVTTATLPGNGPGLKAEYFNDQMLTDLQFTRLDPTVNFGWGGHLPDTRLTQDHYSVSYDLFG